MHEPLHINHLLKAQKTFEQFRINIITNQAKTGTVHAFTLCYELAWKMMKRILFAHGLETESPKSTFRKAALEKIIDDPELWFEFQEKRNLTVHTYEQENLDKIVAIFDIFSAELDRVIKRMQEISFNQCDENFKKKY